MDSTTAQTSCGYVRLDLPPFVAAVDSATFAASAACGACLRITTAAGEVEAQVVDIGPSKTASNQSAVAVNRAALIVLVPDGSTFVEQGVRWQFVPCQLTTGGMTFTFQSGSSASYAAVLIQNHRQRLAAVEYCIFGICKPLTRATYNYWIAANGMGAGPFLLRMTDVWGAAVEQVGVPLTVGKTFVGDAQFPACLLP